jgi:SAM-dependent methyltransferase
MLAAKFSFAHPVHHTPLIREKGGFRCQKRGDYFPDEHGLPSFLPSILRSILAEEHSDFVNKVKTFLRRSPTLYRILTVLISPVCFTGLTGKKFTQSFPPDAVLLNIGSGVHRYRDTMVNLDVYPYEGVDVLADASALPFPDGTFDGVLCEALLEHVRDPQAVIREMLRVLKVGGRALSSVPFVYPFHACPNDFYRWSVSGAKELWKEADIVSIELRAGPTSALVAQLVTFFAIVFSFGSTSLYNFLSMILLPLFAPLKFLDYLLVKLPTALHGAEGFSIVVRKPVVR